MYCVHCGKMINDNSRFCPYCGGQQPVGNNPNNPNNPSFNNMIDNVGDEIGNGIDEAVNYFKKEIESGNDTISRTVERAEERADDVRRNWKDYLTAENMELLSALALALPLFMVVASLVIGMISGILRVLPIVGFVFALLPILIQFIFVLVSAAGIVSIAYTLSKNQEKRNLWAYLTAAGDVLAFVACLGIMLGWTGLSLVLGMISLIYGIDAISRVIIQRRGIESQPEVGKDLQAYKIWYENYKREHPSEQYDVAATNPNNSYFDGSGLSCLGLLLLSFLVSSITCGFAAPWMICKTLRWRKSHTVIDGRRLAFTGTGGSLFGHWLLWEFLSVITCGIYLFFLHVALERWEMRHTTYADQPFGSGDFDGNSFQYFGYGLLQLLLLLITCGLAAPWTITMIQKWEMRHSIIFGDRLRYDGSALGLLGQYIIIALLCVITLGIYYPWGAVRINKYIYSHTHIC